MGCTPFLVSGKLTLSFRQREHHVVSLTRMSARMSAMYVCGSTHLPTYLPVTLSKVVLVSLAGRTTALWERQRFTKGTLRKKEMLCGRQARAQNARRIHTMTRGKCFRDGDIKVTTQATRLGMANCGPKEDNAERSQGKAGGGQLGSPERRLTLRAALRREQPARKTVHWGWVYAEDAWEQRGGGPGPGEGSRGRVTP